MSEYASDGRKITGWAVEGTEPELVHPDIQNAVESWLDAQDGDIPETVTLVGQARMQPPSAQWIAEAMLDHVYECMAEDYEGDPVDHLWTPIEPTNEIRARALRLAELIRSEYRVFWCEDTDVRVMAHTADYMETNQ